MKNYKGIVIALIAVIVGLVIFGTGASKFNQEVELRNLFNAKMDGRSSFYDGMIKTFKQQAKISKVNDSSYRENLNIVMTNRKDGDNILMKWVQEANPLASYKEVSELYKNLSRTIEAKREGFLVEEQELQDIVREHNNLLETFPSNIFMGIFGKKKLKYKPITSTSTDEVMRSGKDDNIDIGL